MSKVLFFTISLLSATLVYSQEKGDIIVYLNEPLVSALERISEKHNIKFSYDYALLKKYKISDNYSSHDLNDLLNQILKNCQLEYIIVNDIYIIKPFEKKEVYTIYGEIKDESTGEKLPYATISDETSKKYYITDNQGNFVLYTDSRSKNKYLIKYLGYKEKEVLLSPNNNESKIVIKMEYSDNLLKKVDVTDRMPKLIETEGISGHFTINTRFLNNLPVIGEVDLFRSLQLFPGISATNSSSGLVIQGAQADQTLVTFDGMTLLDQDHFFGMFSTINSNAVKNIQVYKGGFEAKYGNRVSSVVEITGRTANTNKPRAQIDLNFLNANAVVEVPILKKASLLIAARSSFGNFYKTIAYSNIVENIKSSNDENYWLINGNLAYAKTNINPDFQFYDLNLKFNTSFLKDGNLSFSLYECHDLLNFSLKKEGEIYTMQSDEEMDWGTRGIGVKWTKKWTPKFGSEFLINYSEYTNRHFSKTTIITETLQNDSLNLQSTNTERDSTILDVSNIVENINLKCNLTYYLNKKNTLEFGSDNQFTRIDYSSFKYGLQEQAFYQRLDHFSPFIQDKISVSSRIGLIAGIRLNLIPRLNVIDVEPRISGTYRITEKETVKVSFGSYHQYLHKITSRSYDGIPRDYWILADDSIARGISSTHYIIGLSHKSKSFLIDIEGYYKHFDNIVLYDNYYSNYYKSYAIDTSGYHQGQKNVFGIDFLINKSIRNYTTWLAYTYSKSFMQFNTLNKQEKFSSFNDMRHEIKVGNILNMGNWIYSLTWRFGTGRPDPSPDQDYLLQNDLSSPSVFVSKTKINNSRLPSFHSLDIAAYYKFAFMKKEGKLGLSLINIYNRKNIKSRIYVKNGYEFYAPLDKQVPAFKVYEINLPGIITNISLSIKI